LDQRSSRVCTRVYVSSWHASVIRWTNESNFFGKIRDLTCGV
jgi:hypothetical protein